MARLTHLSEKAKEQVRQRRQAQDAALCELDAATGAFEAAVERRARLVEVEDGKVRDAGRRRLGAAVRYAEFTGVDVTAELTGIAPTELRKAAGR